MILIVRLWRERNVGGRMSSGHNVRSGVSVASLAGWLAMSCWLVPLGAAAQATAAPPGFTQTVYLEYREVDSYVAGSALTITPRAEPFKKEPDWGGRKICRGTINSAFHGVQKPGADPTNSINLPFAWDYQKGKLYLDVNRNGDLTDDPVYSTKPTPGEYFYQSFTNLHLTFDAQASAHQVRMQINLYGHAGQNSPGGNLMWYSYWQGKAMLGGRECEVGLIENPNHLGSTAEAYLLLRLWQDREKPFNTGDGRMTAFLYCTNLFACGQAYQLKCAYLPGNAPRFKLELAEADVELGEVALTGKYIERLILRAHQAKVPYFVVLDRPEATAKIPVGTYNNCWVTLKEKETEAYSDYREWLGVRPITIAAGKAAVLHAGGPLTNWVSVENQGHTLALEYQMQGDGGRYRLMGPEDRTKAPEVAIYQKGKKVGSGRFEYG
jgi:hypothetical protein